MPPRAKKVAPPADLDSKNAANTDGGDLDALRAEVAAEGDEADWPKLVPLGDTAVRVKHFLDWPVSADEDLSAGRLTSWARKVLYGDDFAKVWAPLDPTNRQIVPFFTDLEATTGIPFVTRFASPTS